MKLRITAALAALAVVAQAGPSAAQIAEAQVTGGRVAGTVADGLSIFKGIPFAAPPVGSLRWKAPQPAPPWSGVKQTVAFGPACMQASVRVTGVGAGVPYKEDCLYLDIWTPAKAPGDKLPVIAWIYGGGFTGGATSSPLYDGANFAKRGVVFVSISYRVGPFGFLATPELSRESGHGSGNYGLLDQIAGLKWVRANISRFGGDPSKVTILGHSAGGFSVSILAASPQAKGLFRGVISESGANFAPPMDGGAAGGNLRNLAVAETAGKAWLEGLGAKTLASARALPAEMVEKAQRDQGAPLFWPSVDNYVLPGDQVQLWREGRFNDTPILVGDVSDEAGGAGARKLKPADFVAQVREGYGAKADVILNAYPHATDEQATRARAQLATDSTYDWGQFTWARLEASNGKNKTFVYEFDLPTQRNPNGSSHGQEVRYVFGNLGDATADDRALSDRMQAYWVNFAKTGDPNGAGLPRWPAFTLANPQAMRFGVRPGPAPYPNQDRMAALDDYYAWRRAGSH